MASFLAIQSATVSGLAAIPSAALQRPTTASLAASSPATVADSTTVTLSNAAQALSVIGGTANVPTTTIGAASTDGLVPAANGAVASERSALNASLALRALVDDPGLRAIKNQSDPLYSALIAASRLSDFVPAAPAGVNLSAIAAEIPTPISPAAASRAIDFYRETAEETSRQLATA
jgi:hypothetical protein